jgi:isopenicillin-N epimerase
MDRYLLPLVAYSVRETAKFINCPAEELVPLQNVTSGLNSIINSVSLMPGDEMICLSITYGSTKKIMKDACVRSGAILRIVDVSLPILSAESVVTILSKALSNRTKLVVLDQITSNTAMILPIADMGCISKEVGAVVVIDAAHALFSQDVSIYNADQNLLWNYNASSKTKINDTIKNDISKGRNTNHCIADFADVWITNAHKWMCAPKGCAFMWISPRMTGKIRPAIISHGYTPSNKKGFEIYADGDRLLSSYSWDGCRDYSSILTMPSTISLWKQLSRHLSQKTDKENNMNSNRINSNNDSKSDDATGLDDSRSKDVDKNTDLSILRNYNKQILIDATELLSSEWGIIESDFAGPKEMRENSPMILV